MTIKRFRRRFSALACGVVLFAPLVLAACDSAPPTVTWESSGCVADPSQYASNDVADMVKWYSVYPIAPADSSSYTGGDALWRSTTPITVATATYAVSQSRNPADGSVMLSAYGTASSGIVITSFNGQPLTVGNVLSVVVNATCDAGAQLSVHAWLDADKNGQWFSWMGTGSRQERDPASVDDHSDDLLAQVGSPLTLTQLSWWNVGTDGYISDATQTNADTDTPVALWIGLRGSPDTTVHATIHGISVAFTGQPPAPLWVDDNWAGSYGFVQTPSGPRLMGAGAFGTIADAVKVAPEGATIRVRPGTYSPSAPIVFEHDVHLIGDPGPAAAAGPGSAAPVLPVQATFLTADGQTSISGFEFRKTISIAAITGSGLTLDHNRFAAPDAYLAVGTFPLPGTVAASHNQFLGPAGVDNQGTAWLNARYNWWGAASGPSTPGNGPAATVVGNVYDHPWCTTPLCGYRPPVVPTTPVGSGPWTATVAPTTLASPDGLFTVTIPSGDVPAGDVATLKRITGSDAADLVGQPGYIKIGGTIYQVTVTTPDGTEVHTFNPPLTLTYHYTPSDLPDGATPNDLYAMYWDDAAAAWLPLPSAVDTDTHTVTATTGHLTTFALVAAAGLAVPSDIAGHWAEPDVLNLLALGDVDGYPDGTFRPNAAVTRAQFAKMLVNVLGLQPSAAAQPPFADAADIPGWAAGYVQMAARQHLVTGFDDGTFRPNEPITREQVAVLIARSLSLQLPAGDQTKALNFRDAASIDAWAAEGVERAASAGIVTGYADGTFRPHHSTTRAEAAAMLDRLRQALAR